MALLEDVPLDDLHDALAEVDARKPTQRLMLAILYKQGPSVPMIADWFDMREDTVYRWFREMEREPLRSAIYDDPRPGRPAKLDDEQRSQFELALQRSPEEAGFEASQWTPQLAQRYLREKFDTNYTLRHTRRLLHAADVTWETTRTRE